MPQHPPQTRVEQPLRRFINLSMIHENHIENCELVGIYNNQQARQYITEAMATGITWT